MTRTLSPASALSIVVALAALSACSQGPRAYGRPAPTPGPVEPVAEQPAPAPETIGETFELDEDVKPAPVPAGLLGTAQYDLPVEANRWVEMEVSFLVNQRRDVVGRWLQRADRFEAWVRDVLASYGVPRDLHHLAMIESGYQPTVRSHAGAVGMWQFMPATGRGMGLRIDDVVDERMDPVRSTHAAARHLRDLHRDFRGDWALAAAAYNAGGGRISRGMSRYGARDFWDLAERGDLARETRHYVPRLYAVTIIAKDRQRFGYPAPAGLVRPFGYDSVRVDVQTPLAELARIGNLPAAELAELNPHLYRGMAPANYWVWVPVGQGTALHTAFQASDYRRRGGYASYTLRRGDDLSSIAAASGMTEAEIRSLNLSSNVDRLGRGDRIRLWADAARVLESRPRLASRDEENSDGETRQRRRPRVLGDDRVASASTESRSSESRSSGSSERRSETRTADASERRASERRSSEGRSSESSERRSTESRRSESGSARSEEGSSRRSERVATRDGGGERSERSGTSESRRRASSDGESSSARKSAASGERRSEASSSRRSESSSSSSSRRTHTVEEGETLWGIARRFDVTVAQVREANDLGENATIQPGQTLRIPRATPSSSSSSTRVASSSGEGERSSSRRSESGGESRRGETRSEGRRSRVAEHVVKSGETLWSIARSYDSSVEAIRDANGMDADSVIQPGQKLRVPRAASTRD